MARGWWHEERGAMEVGSKRKGKKNMEEGYRMRKYMVREMHHSNFFSKIKGK